MPATTHPCDPRLTARRLTYALPDGRALLQDLTLSFGRERTGLIGPNGSGKTTFVRLLAGTLEPTSGTVHRTGSVAVLPQDLRPPPGAPLSLVLGIEERLAALRRLAAGDGTPGDIERVGDDWDLPERALAMLARFGLGHLSLDRPVQAVSGGEATRTALAGLALRRPDFILLDEPTNHLDVQSRQSLYAFVDDWSGGVLCVSHDRALLGRMDRIVELSSSGAREYGGNYDHYRACRNEETAAAERELDSARAALRRSERKAREVQERQARRDARGRRQRAHANMPKILLNARRGQAEGTGARLLAAHAREVEERRARAEAARRRVDERDAPRFELSSAGVHPGRSVLQMEDVTVRFGGRTVLDRLSLHIVGAERVAVTGRNGSGKTTLLRVATGRLAPESGAVRSLPPEDVTYLDQGGAPLEPEATVLDNFRTFHPRMDETAVRYALARFLFPEDAALQRVATLSGGQRLRASLACLLGGDHPPSLLVLDEPTNHLDLEAMEAFEAALDAYDGALLVASHDTAFLEGIGIERRLALRDGRAHPCPTPRRGTES